MKLLILAALLVASTPSPARAQSEGGPRKAPENKAAPEGYRWHEHAASRGRFLVPDGWKVQETTHGDVLQLRISPRPIPPESTVLQTAFTIHVFASPAHRKDDGMARIRQWIAGLRSLREARVEAAPMSLPPMDALRVIAVVPVDLSTETPAFRMGGFGVANTETGAFYIARFEAPEAEWEKVSGIAQTLLGGMVLETEF